MGSDEEEPRRLRLRPARPVDLGLTLSPLRHGAGDPAFRWRPDGAWRASLTPRGPATLHLAGEAGEVAAEAWGPGAAWALERVASLTGQLDDDDDFRPAHPLLADLHRLHSGLRIPRTERVFEAVLAAIAEQKVTAAHAQRSWRLLLLAHGEPAPGPIPLRVPPAPAVVARLHHADLHRLGFERRRAETAIRAAGLAVRLEEITELDPAAARSRVLAVPGLGPWTWGEVALSALGDADAVPVGDYHHPSMVAWALAGEPRADDARMLELLEPYRGHRGRVLRLLLVAHAGPPRRGPGLRPGPMG